MTHAYALICRLAVDGRAACRLAVFLSRSASVRRRRPTSSGGWGWAPVNGGAPSRLEIYATADGNDWLLNSRAIVCCLRVRDGDAVGG